MVLACCQANSDTCVNKYKMHQIIYRLFDNGKQIQLLY